MFVTFEGIDGSGKSTQVALLLERLGGLGLRALLFREPGGTILSEHVRRLLLDPALPIEPLAEMLLFSAARAQLVAEQIQPALNDGAVVICDRFFDSTSAYQGNGRGVADPKWIRSFNERVTGGLVPDRTYLLEIAPEAALARRTVRAAAQPEDRMERSDAAFHQRVAEGYRQLAESEPGRIYRLDALAPPQKIHEEIWADLEPRLRGGTR
jgi:dTMP kinase